MKNEIMCFEKNGLISMSESEMLEIEGGGFGLLTLPITGFLAGYLYQKIVEAVNS